MDPNGMLAPIIGLALWTHVMWVWMYATRLPAMRQARMRPDPEAPRGEQMAQLPPRVRWKADNYNHLLEHPTVFYAVAVVAALVDPDAINRGLGWAYVGLRVVHSLVQALNNKIEVRFVVFALSTLVLMALTVRVALVVI
jgi:hypothetical protein